METIHSTHVMIDMDGNICCRQCARCVCHWIDYLIKTCSKLEPVS